MDLFPEQFAFINDWLAARERRGDLQRLEGNPLPPWPAAGQRNLVIGQDIAVELGHPDDGSVAFLIWRASTEDCRGGRTYLVGPDLRSPGSAAFAEHGASRPVPGLRLTGPAEMRAVRSASKSCAL